MTAAEDRHDAAAAVADAWRELHALATAMRPDFDAVDWQGAIIACRNSGVPFADVAPVVWRLAWDTGSRPEDAAAEVRNLARDHGRRQVFDRGGITREERAELLANALDACEAATERHKRRSTGEQPVLRDEPRGGAP